jgi:hypothetical protein
MTAYPELKLCIAGEWRSSVKIGYGREAGARGWPAPR